MLGAFSERRYEHGGFEAQIVEDTVWFLSQLKVQPAPSLLFGEQRDQFLPQINATPAELRSRETQSGHTTHAETHAADASVDVRPRDVCPRRPLFLKQLSA